MFIFVIELIAFWFFGFFFHYESVPARVQDPGPIRDRLYRAPVASPIRHRQGRVRAALLEEHHFHLLLHLPVHQWGEGAPSHLYLPLATRSILPTFFLVYLPGLALLSLKGDFLRFLCGWLIFYWILFTHRFSNKYIFWETSKEILSKSTHKKDNWWRDTISWKIMWRWDSFHEEVFGSTSYLMGWFAEQSDPGAELVATQRRVPAGGDPAAVRHGRLGAPQVQGGGRRRRLQGWRRPRRPHALQVHVVVQRRQPRRRRSLLVPDSSWNGSIRLSWGHDVAAVPVGFLERIEFFSKYFHRVLKRWTWQQFLITFTLIYAAPFTHF